VNALKDALENFEGGVLLVSHDAKLISELDCELRYEGNFEEYKEKIIQEINNK
jgi:ATPase subunit of ABC transporter with duplicated ATPase domains